MKADTGKIIIPGLPADATVSTKTFSLKKIEFEFRGETYSFSVLAVFILAAVVGLAGGVYGIGGGSIIAPFCVSVLGLPVYTVAGAALCGTFLTSIAGVGFFAFLAATSAGAAANVAPDWLLGALFGADGLAGTYTGAYIQKYLKETFVKKVLAVLVIFPALRYILQFFW